MTLDMSMDFDELVSAHNNAVEERLSQRANRMMARVRRAAPREPTVPEAYPCDSEDEKSVAT
eukprot:CAMPEP_0206617604 /NCGR_PEP_ID=MMETSP0325_2-20121206/59717_1 /ASSEMBLY_ACC=CAM_ASM_000347 /TAXON_ID=2866 /ORGANISM="Crypthecodinium cohnii, Strain Seligo" /LENGTH=61 /DNA_ID=CAMNT_0054139585 /DNA_START=12 /DNA_END=194 /DNA_ORIENTATION=+